MDVRKGEFLSQSSAQSLKLQYWGHKFEACCGGSDVVDVESEWCALLLAFDLTMNRFKAESG
jgi:hypothetical protein